jgi:hypothetical protein
MLREELPFSMCAIPIKKFESNFFSGGWHTQNDTSSQVFA